MLASRRRIKGSWQRAVGKEQLAICSGQKAIGKNASLFSRTKTTAMWNSGGDAPFNDISFFIFYYAIDDGVDDAH
jgi:hypothetical protein